MNGYIQGGVYICMRGGWREEKSRESERKGKLVSFCSGSERKWV